MMLIFVSGRIMKPSKSSPTRPGNLGVSTPRLRSQDISGADVAHVLTMPLLDRTGMHWQLQGLDSESRRRRVEEGD